ncbi:MAG: polysaccharide lyase 11 [Candidatus Sumerlaeia bacterium]
MKDIALKVIREFHVGSPIGQCRAVPVSLGGACEAILLAHCGNFDVDPFVEMFFFPSDTLKLSLFDHDGKMIWQRDLGKAVVPGQWFCPVLAFDLDGDGIDEIWFVNNTDPDHPLAVSKYVLERIDPHTGKTTGQWPWPSNRKQALSHVFRNFIIGGYVHGKPVLVTAQGTYEDMHLQGWNPGMAPRWQYDIPKDAAGARGSHMSPVVDLNQDGIDELMWGERCIELDTGRELFCADRDSWNDHSDVIQPFWNADEKRWYWFTTREGGDNISPRVVMFDDQGQRVWSDVDQGHMDMGWVARLKDDRGFIASAIRIGHKTCGPDGRFHTGMTEFAYDAMSGEEIDLGFSTYRSLPVDINGDGYHELVCGRASGEGAVLDRKGRKIAELGGPVAMLHQFMNLAGEQLLVYLPDGTIRVWADENAEDCDAAKERYVSPFYRTNRKLTAIGYNLINLGGI